MVIEPTEALNLALSLVAFLNTAGHDAYLVGGCVRDFARGDDPKDFDVTTSATPDEILALFPDSSLIGAHFGVCRVPFHGDKFEVATFRTEGPYSDSRHPDYVSFTKNVVEDLKRRDFTINTLLMRSDGMIVDHFRGLTDLREMIVRAVGDPHKRFEEDALRMLRAVRFAARFEMDIEADTYRAISEHAWTILAISKERIAQELTRILTSGHAERGITLLRTTNLLAHLLPEVLFLSECTQNPKYHPEGDVYTHTLGLLRQLPAGCSPTLAWAALLHDTGKPATAVMKNGHNTFHGHEDISAEIAVNVLSRLKFSRDFIETVRNHCAQHMRFRASSEMRRSKLMRFIGQPNFQELLELHRLDSRAGSGDLSSAEFIEKVLKETPESAIYPPRLICGADLKAMGLNPGPEFRVILDRVAEAQLAGDVATREDALALASLAAEKSCGAVEVG